jgi:hypothetical protein
MAYTATMKASKAMALSGALLVALLSVGAMSGAKATHKGPRKLLEALAEREAMYNHCEITFRDRGQGLDSGEFTLEYWPDHMSLSKSVNGELKVIAALDPQQEWVVENGVKKRFLRENSINQINLMTFQRVPLLFEAIKRIGLSQFINQGEPVEAIPGQPDTWAFGPKGSQMLKVHLEHDSSHFVIRQEVNTNPGQVLVSESGTKPDGTGWYKATEVNNGKTSVDEELEILSYRRLTGPPKPFGKVGMKFIEEPFGFEGLYGNNVPFNFEYGRKVLHELDSSHPLIYDSTAHTDDLERQALWYFAALQGVNADSIYDDSSLDPYLWDLYALPKQAKKLGLDTEIVQKYETDLSDLKTPAILVTVWGDRVLAKYTPQTCTLIVPPYHSEQIQTDRLNAEWLGPALRMRSGR